MDIYRDLRSLNTPTIMTLELNEDEFNRFPGGNCIFFLVIDLPCKILVERDDFAQKKKIFVKKIIILSVYPNTSNIIYTHCD